MNPLKKLHKGEAPSALDGLSGEHELIASGTPSQQAQALLVRALTSDNPADCRPLIELALETDPDNIEALFALAQVSGSVEESKSLLERAAEITVQRIGPTALNAPDATFAESRDGQSYLAILLCLGTFLWATGDRAAAIGCGVEALRLDPLDNQLARVNLVSWMIAVGDDERAGQLFATYPVTPSSSWRYSRALWLYRAEGPSPQALEVLVEAMVMNPGTFVALATSALPFDIDALGPGMLLEIESATYYTTASVAWIESEGALDWLASLVEGDTGSDLPGIPKFSGLASQRGRRQMGRAGKVTAKRSPKTAKLLQIKVSLRWAPKPIWRQLLVEKSTTLADLHDIIQIAMGWGSEHLFEFRAGKKRFIVPDDGPTMGAGDAQVAKLSDSLKKPKDWMLYIYDYGDTWEHDVVLEELVGHAEGVKYPRCVGGAGACPPEDCGGVGDFADLVEALGDPLHPSHEYARDRLGPDYDPDAFDLDAVNRRMGSRLNEEGLDDGEPNPWF